MPDTIDNSAAGPRPLTPLELEIFKRKQRETDTLRVPTGLEPDVPSGTSDDNFRRLISNVFSMDNWDGPAYDPGPHAVGGDPYLHTYPSDIYSTGPENVVPGHIKDPLKIVRQVIKDFYTTRRPR